MRAPVDGQRVRCHRNRAGKSRAGLLIGAAIAKRAPHRAAAEKFLEFLVAPAAQRIFAAAELEYPVLGAAERAPIVAEMDPFDADALSIDEISRHQQVAVALVKRVGFDD
ncbi:substrate-binding domain-containing protein [Bradyrhizobium sp. McL0616]|uniref:substrate-binding domain-containing protein n=1 Tax=Bradyrhizobium sp. McL0616 TaxID=3415674 RepID=UPI003CF72348